MAKGNIDPAFQAAPFLGESSYNPIEFQRRQKTIKYQRDKLKQEEIEDNTAKGLQKLMIDLKGWEDQEGFKEIVGDHDKVINGFLALSKKGLNLMSPKTSQEIMAYKAITEAQQKIMQKVDVWGRNKDVYDLVTQAIKQDSLKPEDQRNLNPSLTTDNLMASYKGKSILDREMKIENILAFNVKPSDVIKKIMDSKDFYIPTTRTQSVIFNEETGQNESYFKEDMAPADVKENVRRAGIQYEGLTKQYKETITKMRDADPDPILNVMPEKDYFATIAVPTYKKQFLEKTSGGGSGFSINIGGNKINMQPGNLRPEPLPYGEGTGSKTYTNAYIWPVPTKSITVPIGAAGSAQFMGTNWVPIERGGTIEATLYLYDPEKDEYVFNVTSNQNAPWVQNNRPVSIPRSVIGDLLDGVPVKVGNVVKKLKDIYGSAKQVKKELPGIGVDFWKKQEAPYVLKNRK